MGNKTVRGAAMAVVLLCPTIVVAAGAPAETPEQLIRDLAGAARRGDVEGFLAGLTADSRKALKDSLANQAALRQARDEFQKALDERFGRSAGALEEPAEDLAAAIAPLAAAEFLGQKTRTDGSVDVRVKTVLKAEDGKTTSHEDTLVARREGGAWVLALGFTTGGGKAAARKAAADKITQDVRAGKYQDRLSAMVALANAWTRKEGSEK
jgi:hypothetical protein